MEDIDKFVNNSAHNYDGAGCCAETEWFNDNVGTGHGFDWNLGRGRDDSNGIWDSKGYGEGIRYGGQVSAITHEIIGYCYCDVNKENLYGHNR